MHDFKPIKNETKALLKRAFCFMIVTEKIRKVAIQGYEGSYHQMAAEKFYGRKIEIVPCASFQQLAALAINATHCDEAIMAIENSIAGSILPNYNHIVKNNLQIVGEVCLPIHHQLMALPGTRIEDIIEVYSHPMAILQCGNFISKLPNVKVTEQVDTALSAKIISQQRLKNTAAIASSKAAELFNLEIIASSIEDDKNNYTRFLILSREQTNNIESDKASLTLKLAHEPGSLSNALNTIARSRINISKLQSVPIIGIPGQYAFHIDLEFGVSVTLDNMMNELSQHCIEIKLLGKYKKGQL